MRDEAPLDLHEAIAQILSLLTTVVHQPRVMHCGIKTEQNLLR